MSETVVQATPASQLWRLSPAGRAHPSFQGTPGSMGINRKVWPRQTKAGFLVVHRHAAKVSRNIATESHRIGLAIGPSGSIDQTHLPGGRGFSSCVRAVGVNHPSRLVSLPSRCLLRLPDLSTRHPKPKVGNPFDSRAQCREHDQISQRGGWPYFFVLIGRAAAGPCQRLAVIRPGC